MFSRQFCARHGRSALQAPQKPSLIRKATNLADLPPEAQRNPNRAYAAFADREYELQSNKGSTQSQNAQRSTDTDLSSLLARKHRESLTPAGKASSIKTRRKSVVGDYYRALRESRRLNSLGSIQTETEYLPDTHLKRPLPASGITLPKLLASQTHLGHATSLWHPGNSSYIFGIRDGIHIISLETTLAYLRRACRVVTEVARQGGLILFVGTRAGFQEIVVKAAKLSGGYHIFDRWTPGSLTNGQQILGKCRLKVVDGIDKEIEKFSDRLEDYPVARPDLVVCLNPLENEVCLHECGLYNIPTVGIIDTDANSSWVTYPIPANDDSLRSVTLLTMALGKAGQEGQKLRVELARQGKLTYKPRDFGDLFDENEDVKSAHDRPQGSGEFSNKGKDARSAQDELRNFEDFGSFEDLFSEGEEAETGQDNVEDAFGQDGGNSAADVESLQEDDAQRVRNEGVSPDG
ncbi:MAG: hypothetical protein Q9160_001208 [Pyrenula sp. 1 TL-2023]